MLVLKVYNGAVDDTIKFQLEIYDRSTQGGEEESFQMPLRWNTDNLKFFGRSSNNKCTENRHLASTHFL